MMRRVIGHQQQLAEVGLPGAVGNRREEINRRIAGQPLERRAIRTNGADRQGPCLGRFAAPGPTASSLPATSSCDSAG